MAEPEWVADASALILALAGGPAAERAASLLPRALVSAVSLAELGVWLAGRGLDQAEVGAILSSFECAVLPFDEEAARAAIGVGAGAAFPLSLGARACLALAAARDLPVLTADPRWASTPLGVRIRYLR